MIKLTNILKITMLVSVLTFATSASARIPQAGETPILVFMSGFASCPTFVHSPYNTGLHSIHSHLTSAIDEIFPDMTRESLLTCFTKSKSKIRYVTSSDPDYQYTSDKEGAYSALMDLVNKHKENHRVYLVGHSYGGWLAMNFANQLPEWVNISMLVTLDPISPAGCKPSAFVRSLVRSAAWWWWPSTGCTQAPEDTDNAFIASRINQWLNVYQQDYALLHSSAITQARRNIQFEYDTPTSMGFLAHSEIESDEWVKQEIKKFVTGDLGGLSVSIPAE